MIVNIILSLSILFSTLGLPGASSFLEKNLPETSLQYSKIEDPELLDVNLKDISALPVKRSGIEPSINGSAGIAFDLETGELLFGYNENKAFPIASLTKIMTALVVLENINDLNAEVTVSSDAALIEGSRMGIWMEEKITVRDLLYGMLVKSGNDAAKALEEYYDDEIAPKNQIVKEKKQETTPKNINGAVAAQNTQGEKEETKNLVELMNDKASLLGLKNTEYHDTSGINEKNVSSLKDLAILMRYALQNEDISYIMQTEYYTAQALNGSLTHPMMSTNRLLRTRDDVIAGKTGYSEAAGWNHSAVVKSTSTGGHRVFVGVLGTEGNDERFDECRKIIDWVYNSYRW